MDVVSQKLKFDLDEIVRASLKTAGVDKFIPVLESRQKAMPDALVCGKGVVAEAGGASKFDATKFKDGAGVKIDGNWYRVERTWASNQAQFVVTHPDGGREYTANVSDVEMYHEPGPIRRSEYPDEDDMSDEEIVASYAAWQREKASWKNEANSGAVPSYVKCPECDWEAQVVDRKFVNEAYVAEPKTFGQVSEYVSQKTKDAHVELYKHEVDSLNKISAELDTVDKTKADSGHSDYRSLKLDETYNTNAVYLHELFFANCFDPNSEVYMDSMSYLRLQRDFATFEDWQRDFMACALSAGEGWAVCGYNVFLKRYVNTFVSHHSGDVMIGFIPMIVLDMWSHAYYRDYLTDKKSYLTAMMRQFNWGVIEDRFKKAETIAQAVK